MSGHPDFEFCRPDQCSYDRGFIFAMVVTAYLGWAAYGAVAILLPSQPSSNVAVVTVGSASVLLVSWALFAVQSFPLSFYLYIAFPCYFWQQVLIKSTVPVSRLIRSGSLSTASVLSLLWRTILVVITLQSMVVGRL